MTSFDQDGNKVELVTFTDFAVEENEGDTDTDWDDESDDEDDSLWFDDEEIEDAWLHDELSDEDE